MFSASKTAKVSGGATDSYYEYVTMLLNGDGTNGAQNNTFVDGSTNNFSITRYGNTTQGSLSPYGSLWSNYFTTSAYLGLGSSSNWTLGSSGDFTVEGWIFANGTQDSYATVVTNTTSEASGYENKFIVLIRSGNILSWRDDTGSTSISATIALNQWNHFAFVRSGSTITGYLNGTSIGTQTSAQAYTSTGTSLLIGGGVASANSFKGQISNLRIVKGTAVYTSNFTPSTTPLTAVTNTVLLTCQSNRFIDNSSNNATITASGTPSVQRFSPFNPTASYSTATIGGSGYFDGNGDYLQIPYNSANNLAGDFTIEFWLYLNPITGGPNNGYNGVFMMRDSPSWSSGGLMIGIKNNYLMEFYTYDQGSLFTTAISPNTWNHFAFVRSGSTVSSYVNGVFCNSYTASTTFNGAGGPLWMGNNYDGTNYYLNGYVTDLRVVNGTALYSGSTYTVPTAPLTAVSNTSLLMNYKNAGIPDYAMMNDLETVGNARISTSVKKFGTGSLYFDGNGDWLSSADGTVNTFNTGDFTIEGWAYTASYGGSTQQLVSKGSSGSGSGWYVAILSNGTLQFGRPNSPVATSSNTVGTNAWFYFSVTRQNGTTKVFINGNQEASVSDTANYTDTTPTYVGVFGDGSSQPFNGYLDDVRITKGYARYTATFTPPTAALPTY